MPDKWFETTPETLLAICLSSAGIYLAVIVFTRLFGKRSFSKMSSFDFAMTVAVGSIIATTILSASVSLLEGVVGLAATYVLQMSAAFLRRFDVMKSAIDNSPLLLMDGETILEDNLRKAKVSKGDLRSKLREANVIHRSQVKAVVFETTGDVSVLHTGDEKSLDDWLMEDVQRS